MQDADQAAPAPTTDWAPVDVAELAAEAALPAPADATAPPTMHLLVLTCMDARIRPHLMLGLGRGTMHVVRNAGGRVDGGTMRSLLLSTWALGTRQIAIIHHTRCGAAGTDEELSATLSAAGAAGPFPALLGTEDAASALRADVDAVRGNASLPTDIVVTGHVYELETGRLVPLAELEARN